MTEGNPLYVDVENRFSNAQSITTGSDSGSTPGVRSTNIIDLKQVRGIGAGEPLFVVVQVTTTLASSGSNDYMDVNLYTDGDEAFGSPTYVQQIARLPAVAVAGTVQIGGIRPSDVFEQYIGLYYLSQADVFSAAGITAFITRDVQQWVAYAKGYTIS